MSEVFVVLCSITLILGYTCLNFHVYRKTKGLKEILDLLVRDRFVVTVCICCIGILVIKLLWFSKKDRYYVHRISMEDYKVQANEYTQKKVNELVNSKEYREYIRKPQIS
ncbi:hypothetical protein SteCoe_9671 [Stentor coeruleus]|uniref:BAP29/BAP31 transmembrane domain-containing protein n=1 Tax=Stentor coeruleus TaxID=5963 RepID=A0A1R2CHL1_9CILI|nr:hypothetical protein SteCoe_9671 [Stentor coeruleus]